jgi:hypothetical protein
MFSDTNSMTSVITLYGISEGRKIAAIKALRAMAELRGRSMGLKAGKALVDRLQAGTHTIEIRCTADEMPILRLALSEGFLLHQPQSRKLILSDYFEDRRAPVQYDPCDSH